MISIITITYNAADTLQPTMDSVASQTWRDFEHIIVDGASQDNTLSIARRYPDVRIISERDKGLYDAMNKGIRLAKGDYLIFLNSGDTFHSPTTLEAYAAAAAKGADIIYGDTLIVDNHRQPIGPRHYNAPEQLTFMSFSKGMLICHQAFMVRKELAPDYDLSYRFSADYDWTIRCIGRTSPERCVNLHQVTIDYLCDGLTDNNKRKSLLERYHIMARHYGHLRALKRHLQLITNIFNN